ncbi:Alpha/Beta hydrolase protein [Flagelloscypha sp. PMI_526]|nr:Alpha/Beta hydrolase protein [Flagelloscypha sp. PMI_526]
MEANGELWGRLGGSDLNAAMAQRRTIELRVIIEGCSNPDENRIVECAEPVGHNHALWAAENELFACSTCDSGIEGLSKVHVYECPPLLSPAFFHSSQSVNLMSSSKPENVSQPDSPSLSPINVSHYATPGISPPSARVNPRIVLQESPPVHLWDLWKYGLVVTKKACEMSVDVLSHCAFGARRKSWGIEMTVITSFMRGAARNTHLVNIHVIRTLMSLAGFVPLPADALITPVTFRVKRRGLRGILAEYDAAETGTRELSGEWVVGSRRMWHRMQSEWKKRKSDKAGPSKHLERIILYIHGGAYYVSSAATQRLISIPLSKYTDARVFALDYRLAPETTFPGPLHDVATGYFRLIEELHVPPENIVVAGDSAGGGLCLALLMYLRDNNYPLPAAAILMSPWVDLTMSCESWDSNADFDVVPMPHPSDPLNPVHLYLGERTEEYLTHPYASPLFGDFKGLPPLLIQSGDAEVLRDEITLLAHKASLAGVHVQHELYEDAVHIFQIYPFLESARRSFISMREFVKDVFHDHAPRALDSTAEQGLEKELENDGVMLVRGDGLEVASGLDDARKEISTCHGPSSSENTSSDGDDTDETQPSLQRERSSWVRSPIISPLWPQRDVPAYHSPSSSDEENDSDAPLTIRRVTSTVQLSDRSKVRRRSETLPSQPLAPRIPTSTTSSSSSTPRPKPVNRTQSFSRAFGGSPLNLSGLTMTSERTAPPSPSLRRAASRTASHPDLFSLVDDWTQSGPANVTRHYQHARAASSRASLHR